MAFTEMIWRTFTSFISLVYYLHFVAHQNSLQTCIKFQIIPNLFFLQDIWYVHHRQNNSQHYILTCPSTVSGVILYCELGFAFRDGFLCHRFSRIISGINFHFGFQHRSNYEIFRYSNIVFKEKIPSQSITATLGSNN